MSNSVGHRPTSTAWEFDSSVVAVFEDMLARSIPGFEDMRRVVTEVGRAFVKPGATIVDLGCSKGGSLAPFVEDNKARAYIGVEQAEDMRNAAIERFNGNSRVSILDLDLRYEYPEVLSNLTLSVLTVQFTPIEYRHKLLKRIYETLKPGGAFIFVEKCLGSDPRGDELLTNLYLARKAEEGYSTADIEAKRRSLEGVLVPITPAWNEALLRSAGFTTVEPIWRSLNFGAWVAIKGEDK